jgi:hypothetical protein
MSDEMELLREFRADVPAPTEETRRRIHAYATQTARRRPPLPSRLNGLLSRAAWRTPATHRARAVRWGAVALVALALASGGAIAFTTTASGGQGINDLLSQVQNSFGDSRLLSASVNGSTLTVKVAATDEPSAVSATFEAQMLASAVHDAETSGSGQAINSVQYLDTSGAAIRGYGAAPVGTDPSLVPLPSLPPLTKGACNSAAQAVQTSSLTIQSVLTLPYAGGACAFKFQTSDQSNFDQSPVIGKIADVMGDPSQRALLVEVDDQAGVPQVVDSYSPSGGGTLYIKPGLNTSSVGGPISAP